MKYKLLVHSPVLLGPEAEREAFEASVSAAGHEVTVLRRSTVAAAKPDWEGASALATAVLEQVRRCYGLVVDLSPAAPPTILPHSDGIAVLGFARGLGRPCWAFTTSAPGWRLWFDGLLGPIVTEQLVIEGGSRVMYAESRARGLELCLGAAAGFFGERLKD